MNTDPASLDRLRDIVEPAAVAWWPPALGVWFLLALVGVWVSAGIVALLRYRRLTAYRRAGLRELDRLRPRLQSAETRPAALGDLARLLKRVALAGFPRTEVAGLSGETWLAFLSATGGSAFGTDPARRLPLCLYSPALARTVTSEAAEAIVRAAREWIVQHHHRTEH